MNKQLSSTPTLSPWWRRSVLLVFVVGMIGLIFMSVQAYRYAPPIPEKVVDSDGKIIFSRTGDRSGPTGFLKIWPHAERLDLGPRLLFGSGFFGPVPARTLAGNRTGNRQAGIWRGFVYIGCNPSGLWWIPGLPSFLKKIVTIPYRNKLTFIDAEKDSFQKQLTVWTDYFKHPVSNSGLPDNYINDPEEIRQLTAFFAWTAWASVANRPDKLYSYTNNFPYDPTVGNRLTSDAVLWSALSVAMLLAGLAVVLTIFGKFDYLGWKGGPEGNYPQMLIGEVTEGQKATIKYFFIVALLFLTQVMIGGALAHYRAEPGNFYGIDLAQYLPSNILRTWHLQLAIFWIATAYIAGGLLLASSLSQKEPRGHAMGVHMLFWALVVLVAGSLLGELAGIHQLFGGLWSWFGHQGWEFLELGRFWQIILVIGFSFWLGLLYRTTAPALKDPERKEITLLFLGGAAAIPFFYLPAFFFGSTSNFTVVDMWRFWIIHLWVEGFFELFVTVLVAVTFYQLGVVRRINVVRVIYMDAILFLAGGIIGTAHHWYWTGQANFTMALAAMFSALEVVPLTLLTLGRLGLYQVDRHRGHCQFTEKKHSTQMGLLFFNGRRVLEFCGCRNIRVSDQYAGGQLF